MGCKLGYKEHCFTCELGEYAWAWLYVTMSFNPKEWTKCAPTTYQSSSGQTSCDDYVAGTVSNSTGDDILHSLFPRLLYHSGPVKTAKQANLPHLGVGAVRVKLAHSRHPEHLTVPGVYWEAPLDQKAKNAFHMTLESQPKARKATNVLLVAPG
jgi:hypothetical protein